VEAGVNKYLFTFVNLREHCSWVHMKEKEKATEKAKDLVRMGVARASVLTPQEEEQIDVRGEALVIGGGAAGMSAAISLSKQGFPVHLVERQNELGGFVKEIDYLFLDGSPAETAVKTLVDEVNAQKNVIKHTNTAVKHVEGFIGNFKAVLEKDGKEEGIEIGTIIVATGADVLKPEGLYGYGANKKVVTLHEFEMMCKRKEVPPINRIAFIQCVGSRGQKVTYCSRVCCNSTIRTAINIQENKDGLFGAPAGQAPTEEAAPGAGMMRRRRRQGPASAPGAPAAPSGGKEVMVFYRDIMAYGTHHEYLYNKSRELGVRFIQYTPDRLPEVKVDADKVSLKYFHTALQQELTEDVDLLVLATPMIAPEGVKVLSQMLKVPLGQEGFFFEAHVKLRPVDFATDGVFVCGTAKGPADIMESISQALATASRAGSLMKKGYIQQEALQSVVIHDLCIGCASCVTVCPYNAIEMVDGKACTIVAACKGCGSCAASCPKKAIVMTHYNDDQLILEGISALRTVVI
jgi:heterodisulfide reductase subunit A